MHFFQNGLLGDEWHKVDETLRNAAKIVDVDYVEHLTLIALTGGDEGTIDRFGPNGVAGRVVAIARRTTRLQTGYVYHYAFVMLIGVVALVSWYLLVMRA